MRMYQDEGFGEVVITIHSCCQQRAAGGTSRPIAMLADFRESFATKSRQVEHSNYVADACSVRKYNSTLDASMLLLIKPNAENFGRSPTTSPNLQRARCAALARMGPARIRYEYTLGNDIVGLQLRDWKCKCICNALAADSSASHVDSRIL